VTNTESELGEIDWALKAEEDLAYEPRTDVSSFLNGLEGKQAIAAAVGSYIRDRLREASFARKIIPPHVV
jgi:hypothetical protein